MIAGPRRTRTREVKVLISGASVAGPALAYWLTKDGHEVTVVERADALRSEGQNVDIRGAAIEVVRRMGLEDAVRAANTTEEGTEFVDEAGDVVASIPVEEGERDGPTAELEILRGELARVLYEHVGERAEWVFDEHIQAIEDRGDGAEVTFASGGSRSFDVVAIAEGQRSATRELVFDDIELEPLGLYIAYLTIPRAEHDSTMWRVFNPPGGRDVSLRPDNLGTTRAMLGFMSDERGLDRASRMEQVARLREVFADAGWETPRILAGLDGADFYFEDLAQVKAPTWHRGRTVLLGDAAHCVTPIGGGGTSLALVDAYVLARELAQQADPGAAFAAYEAFLRPTVEAAQKLPPGTPRLAHPKTKVGVRLLRTAEKVLASDLGKPLRTRLTSPLDELELP